ncbi:MULTISPECIES: response regulator transcription factor [unclassified Nocardioides]|uniref:response regulator transcription factor n=1 Tax=unclassified Nocardioides TaxID=2615069 RepID=UPI0036081F5D
MAQALVVEDDPDTRELIELVLRKGGIEATSVENGDEGVRLARELQPDLVTLDVQLPDMEGTEVCRRIREFSDAYVMMITSRSDEVDRLLALDLGADDYLAKPFSPRELAARSSALLRRSRGRAAPAPVAPERAMDDPDGVIEAGGGLVLMPVRHVAMLDGVAVPLTPPEVEVLAVLAREPEREWPRRDLVTEVWGGDFLESEFLIDIHVASLRRKLRKAGAGSDRIRTVAGSAYALKSA